MTDCAAVKQYDDIVSKVNPESYADAVTACAMFPNYARGEAIIRRTNLLQWSLCTAVNRKSKFRIVVVVADADETVMSAKTK